MAETPKASTGPRGTETMLARLAPIHALLTDVLMPDMSGVALAAELRAILTRGRRAT